jgi:regulator of protease activity HflC (stomatin/prohibitin superfamily)
MYLIAGVGALIGVLMLYYVYTRFRIDVPAGHFAVLIKKTGMDLENGQSVSPSEDYKGVQLNVLTEGRYFYNCYAWDWNVYPMIEIPSGKMGVRVRLYGDNLPYGHFLATKESEKGVVPEVLRPGRYPINAVIKGQKDRPKSDYVEIIEIHEPITIQAGYRGVVTNLAGPMPEDPNVLLVPKGFRGVQQETLDAGTYYLNPYMYRVDIIDCRSQRFNLAETQDMGFPSKDGFWVTLDGIIEFRVRPEKAAEVFVVYNSFENDKANESNINDEIIQKIITPNARSFCRLRGSNSKGRDFIGGDTRTAFQKEFQEALAKVCDEQGVEVIQALITKINPPEAIAKPVRDREVAKQQLGQYREQKLQQDAEAKLAIEKALIIQRKELVGAEQDVIKLITNAKEKQKVAVTKAMEDKAVAERDLAAAKDQASAMLSRKKADAKIILLENEAEASGWKKAIDALGGDGMAYARYTLNQKIGPSFRNLMVNTADSPLMDVFRGFEEKKKKKD